MMKSMFYMLAFFCAMVICSCQNEVIVADDDIFHTWEAKSFVSVESVTYEKIEDNPILLTFRRDGTYTLKLDINSCGGTFNADDDHLIKMSLPVCTEACCDSPFSYKLAGMLPKVTSYSIDDNILQLQVPGWGVVDLELVE